MIEEVKEEAPTTEISIDQSNEFPDIKDCSPVPNDDKTGQSSLTPSEKKDSEALINIMTQKKIFIFTERSKIPLYQSLPLSDIYYAVFILDENDNVLEKFIGKYDSNYTSTVQYTVLKLALNYAVQTNITNLIVYLKDKRFTKKLNEEKSYYKIKANRNLVQTIKDTLKNLTVTFTSMGKTIFKKNSKLADEVYKVWIDYIN